MYVGGGGVMHGVRFGCADGGGVWMLVVVVWWWGSW